jgi:hypothetical protein
VSLERRHLRLLRERSYVVADKSDGVRFTLFLCRCRDRRFSFLIDRKLTFYQISVAACRKLFEGSIFDGELVWTTNAMGERSQLFLVFDAVALRGDSSLKKENLFRRLEVIRGAFDLDGRVVNSPECAAALAKAGKIVCGGNPHGLSFRPKACFPMNQLDTLLRQLPSLPYATDGLVFTPVEAPVVVGTAEQTFKLKRAHTIDLQLRCGELWVGQGGGPETALQRVPLTTTGLNFEVELPTGLAENAVIECELSLREQDIVLRYLRVRRDKAHPNTVRTVLSTLKNLRENIQESELCPDLKTRERAQQAPKPVTFEAADRGGAELANVVVGDVLDAQRFAGPFLTSSLS